MTRGFSELQIVQKDKDPVGCQQGLFALMVLLLSAQGYVCFSCAPGLLVMA